VTTWTSNVVDGWSCAANDGLGDSLVNAGILSHITADDQSGLINKNVTVVKKNDTIAGKKWYSVYFDATQPTEILTIENIGLLIDYEAGQPDRSGDLMIKVSKDRSVTLWHNGSTTPEDSSSGWIPWHFGKEQTGACNLMYDMTSALQGATVAETIANINNCEVLLLNSSTSGEKLAPDYIRLLVDYTPNEAPTVSLDSPPVEGQAYVIGNAINLAATANDTDGSVTQVEFFANGASIGTDTLGVDGWSVTGWRPAEGQYALTVEATDDRGAMTASAPVNIDVNIPPEPFTITVTTDNVGTSAADQFTLPLMPGEDYDFTVSFDGQQVSHNTDSDLTLTFPSGPGTYDVEVIGSFPAIYFNNAGDKEKLLEIKAWGTTQWTSMASAFYNCSNMQLTATDTPDLTNVTDMSRMFMTCFGMTSVDVTGWDVSNVTDMTSLFQGSKYIITITGLQTWDMSNVSSMKGMFRYNLSLQSINVTGWQLSAGPSLEQLFYRCYSLTEIIGYETWDVSTVTSLKLAFERVAKMSLDFSSWNTTGALTNLSQMLYRVSATEIKGLENLNVTNVETAWQMLTHSGLATSDYDALLIAWDQQSQLPVLFDAGSSMYTPFGDAQLARESLEAKGWRITDGGTVAGVNPIPESSISSPVSVDGWFGAVSFTVSVDGGAHQSVAEVGGAWYSNVMLNSDAATSIEVKYGTDVVKTQSVTWTPTVIDSDSGQTVTVVKGNSLLLASGVTTGTLLEIDADGDGIFELSGVVTEQFATVYNTAGTFSVTSRIDAVDVGWLTVEVVDVTFPDKVACQVGFTRDVTVEVTRADAANIVFSATPSASMTVETVDIVNDVAHLRITALTRGSPTVVATLGVGGPIVASKEVDEFTLDVPARTGAIIDDDVDVGTSKLTMRPYVSHVRFDFNMFGSQSTFFGGAKFFSINTSHAESSIGEPGFQQVWDEATGETVGEFVYDLEVPDGEDMWCFNITANANPNGVPIGEWGGINGKGCKAFVDTLTVCYGVLDQLVVTTETTVAGTHYHSITIVDDGDSIFPPPKFTAAQPRVQCTKDVVIQGLEVEGRGDPGLYNVKIADTVFLDRIKVPQYPTGVISTDVVAEAGGGVFYGAVFEDTLSVKDPAFENLNNAELDAREVVTFPPNIYGFPVKVAPYPISFLPDNNTLDLILTPKERVDATLSADCSLLPNTYTTPQLLQWKCEGEPDAAYRTYKTNAIHFQVLQGRLDGVPFRWAITTSNGVSATPQIGGWTCPIP